MVNPIGDRERTEREAGAAGVLAAILASLVPAYRDSLESKVGVSEITTEVARRYNQNLQELAERFKLDDKQRLLLASSHVALHADSLARNPDVSKHTDMVLGNAIAVAAGGGAVVETKVVDTIHQADLSMFGNLMIMVAKIQAAGEITTVATPAGQTRNLQFALAYATKILKLIENDGLFEKACQLRLGPTNTKPDRDLLKAKILAEALALIYRTSLGVVGKNGKFSPANITGPEFAALLNLDNLKKTLSLPGIITDDNRATVKNVIIQLNALLDQYPAFRKQLIDYMHTNPSIEQLSGMDELIESINRYRKASQIQSKN